MSLIEQKDVAHFGLRMSSMCSVKLLFSVIYSETFDSDRLKEKVKDIFTSTLSLWSSLLLKKEYVRYFIKLICKLFFYRYGCSHVRAICMQAR